MNVQDIRGLFRSAYREGNFVTDKSGVKMVELTGVSFTADEPTIFGVENREYVEREKAWYDSQSLSVNDIKPPVPEIWKAVASKDGKINSNYGWCVYSLGNEHQYSHVLSTLMNQEQSRRAVMVYTRPSIQEDYRKDGMSDFICTNAVQYLIRDDQLKVIVQMRSNDVVFGYKNDLAWQVEVQERLLTDLNKFRHDGQLTSGEITWQVGSLHIYERHFKYLEI